MSKLTKYGSFEELKADRPTLTKEQLLQKIKDGLFFSFRDIFNNINNKLDNGEKTKDIFTE